MDVRAVDDRDGRPHVGPHQRPACGSRGAVRASVGDGGHNSEFGQADVAIILGANDVVNPAALQKVSPIYGMPILEAYKAETVIVHKRSTAAGCAGLDNELFHMDKTRMVFGDAKKVVEDMVEAIE